MAKIKYQDIPFRAKARETIAQADAIISEYMAQGYSITLRQLYYQFVARLLCPNKQEEYDRLSVHITNGRRAGLIDWDAIVDETRFLRGPTTWEDPAHIIKSCASQFKINLWEHQKIYAEVWFEKDALLNIFERATNPLRLNIFSCRGYVSDSACWRAAQRLIQQQNEGKQVVVLHFGDHDPSGIDMTRDITERLEMFGATPRLLRKALNFDQIKKYNPPPNPAKESDSRFAQYRAEFGVQSWELDSIDPKELVKLVTTQVNKFIDRPQWEKDTAREDYHKETLQLCSDKWPAIDRFLHKKKK